MTNNKWSVGGTRALSEAELSNGLTGAWRQFLLKEHCKDTIAPPSNLSCVIMFECLHSVSHVVNTHANPYSAPQKSENPVPTTTDLLTGADR